MGVSSEGSSHVQDLLKQYLQQIEDLRYMYMYIQYYTVYIIIINALVMYLGGAIRRLSFSLQSPAFDE